MSAGTSNTDREGKRKLFDKELPVGDDALINKAASFPADCKVVIVHEWLVQYGGSEKVLATLLDLFPQADLFTVCDFLPRPPGAPISQRSRATTFVQHLPGARKHYRMWLPLMPLAIEQLDVSGYDLVISNSHAVAKGVLIGPEQLHVSYVHSPMRYAWDLQFQYLAHGGLDRGLRSLAARVMLHYLRFWDFRSGQGVDVLAANSHNVARRIAKVYRRDAHVIYPPVDFDDVIYRENKDDYYLAVSRFVPYKLVPRIVEAFAETGRRLLIVGDGPEWKRVLRAARGHANIELLGSQPRLRLLELLAGARALIHMAFEDFGMTMVEALASGTPVIAYGRGGACEIVQDGVTGRLFPDQSAAALRDAVSSFEHGNGQGNPTQCRTSVSGFSPAHFREAFLNLVKDSWQRNAMGLREGRYAGGKRGD